MEYNLTHGSLSTGIGGFDVGAEENGIVTKWCCEIDELRRDILRYYLPHAEIFEDLTKLKSVPYVDIISFGFPCQDISVANPKGKGIEGEKSSLWHAGWQLIRGSGCRYIIIENSPNITNRGLHTILAQIAQAGYNAEWNVISCQQFGMPHLRKRLFIIAYSQKIRMDSQQVQRSSTDQKYKEKREKTRRLKARDKKQIQLWSGLSGIHRPSFWTEMLTEFHNLDHGIPQNIYQGLVAAAGDTVSPLITSWIFSRIKEIETA